MSFLHLTISHPDRGLFRPREHVRLKKALLDDLYFDYDKEELALEIDESATCLQVKFQLL